MKSQKKFKKIIIFNFLFIPLLFVSIYYLFNPIDKISKNTTDAIIFVMMFILLIGFSNVLFAVAIIVEKNTKFK